MLVEPLFQAPTADVVQMLQEGPIGVKLAGHAELARLLLGRDPA